MSYAICFNLDKSKISLSGKGLKKRYSLRRWLMMPFEKILGKRINLLQRDKSRYLSHVMFSFAN